MESEPSFLILSKSVCGFQTRDAVHCDDIGVMNMLDDGERDDKLIAVLTDKTVFSNIDNIEEFDRLFPGSLLIIRTWFANYKGSNRISFIGFGEKDIAEKILFDAIENYEDKR